MIYQACHRKNISSQRLSQYLVTYPHWPISSPICPPYFLFAFTIVTWTQTTTFSNSYSHFHIKIIYLMFLFVFVIVEPFLTTHESHDLFVGCALCSAPESSDSCSVCASFSSRSFKSCLNSQESQMQNGWIFWGRFKTPLRKINIVEIHVGLYTVFTYGTVYSTFSRSLSLSVYIVHSHELCTSPKAQCGEENIGKDGQPRVVVHRIIQA